MSEAPEGGNFVGPIPLWTKLIYCFPTFAMLPMQVLISVFGNTFYEVTHSADLAYIAFFIALARSMDVMTDPLMAYITDTTRMKFGRRRPYMLSGCWFYGGFIFAFMSPPFLDQQAVSIWFGVTYIGYYLFNTYTNIPYWALGPELTDDYADRSLLFAISGVVDMLGTFVCIGLPPYLTSNVEASTCPVELDGSRMCSRKDKQYASSQSFMMVGGFLATWSIVSMVACVFHIKERGMKDKDNGGSSSKTADEGEPPPLPIVPSLLNTLKNYPFYIMLAAWGGDALVNGTIGAMTPYFIRYVITPELGCSPAEAGEWYCDSINVTARCMVGLLSSALITLPVWMKLCKVYGKRNIWVFWSFFTAFTNVLLCLLWNGLVFKGDEAVEGSQKQLCMFAVVIISINGIPFGAKFLADSILTDVIDYDEFLTGTRSEAVYFMFKGFLPKLVMIPASALPIAIMNSLGHIAPIEGKIQKQPEVVVVFVFVTAAIMPTVGAFLAFLRKQQFPIRTKEQTEEMLESIYAHKCGKESSDCLTGHMFKLTHFTNEEQEVVNIMDHFPGPTVLDAFVEDQQKATAAIAAAMKSQFVLSLAGMSVSILLLWSTFNLIVVQESSYIPTLCIILTGLMITVTAFTYMRLRGAQTLQSHDVKDSILLKIQSARKESEELNRLQRRQMRLAWHGLSRKTGAVEPDDSTN